MPGKKSKKFIDKKNALTFTLVHRSQRDPLQADEDAPKHVFRPHGSETDKSKRKEEQTKYGVYYDDDYDYMQHLRDVDELNAVGPSEMYHIKQENNKVQADPTLDIQLPSSVFGTEHETEVGLLNKATPLRGPQPDWDPDIVAALDEDFDYDNPDNILDDDFMATANAQEEAKVGFRPEIEVMEEDYSSDVAENDDEDCWSDEGSFGEQSFMSAETKSRFTNYSLTSSVMRRNEGLTLLDDRFEKIYEGYDDEEIGALDHEDIGGCIPDDSHILNSVLEEFEEQQKQVRLKDVVEKGDTEVLCDSDSTDSSPELVEVEDNKGEQWDCESILSTYSNLYNHPKLITEEKKHKKIELTKRAGVPSCVLPSNSTTSKKEEREARRAVRGDRANTHRPKQETTEEKRCRKLAIKEERKARREEKKMNKQAFKSEELKQQKELYNVKTNLQGLKIV